MILKRQDACSSCENKLSAFEKFRLNCASVVPQSGETQFQMLKIYCAIPSFRYSELPDITYDLSRLSLSTAANEALGPLKKPNVNRSRVESLKNLATRAFAESVLLYEELGDFPTSLKAPVFAYLVKRNELTSSHLKVLLSNDQKRIDLSPAHSTSPLVLSERPVESS